MAKIKFVIAILIFSLGIAALAIPVFISEIKTIIPLDVRKEVEKDEIVSLIAVGDIMLSRGVADKMDENGYDYPFENVKEYLESADIVFGNLETSITAGRKIGIEEMVFRADTETAEALKNANFSILSLANNHTPNFGAEGLNDTFKYLDNAGIKYIGAGKNSEEANSPAYISIKGKTFAFLAYNDSDVVPVSYEAKDDKPGTAFMRKDKMKNAVKKAKERADFVIVSMHSGNEYVKNPNKRQTEFAHAAIDAGAEIVIGHHPHVVQTIEKYKGKYIFYSLGNFIFDQRWIETRKGLTLKILFDKNGVSGVSHFPILIENFSQPKLVEDKENK